MRLRKPKRVITIGWLNDIHVAVICKRKCFDFFLKNNPGVCELGIDDMFSDGAVNGCSLRWTDSESGLACFALVFANASRRVIVHECVHMVHQVFEFQGIPVCAENSETIAYMTDWIVEEVYKTLSGC